jgi:predicted ATPase/DNA-binding XRE family transcriptional regulator
VNDSRVRNPLRVSERLPFGKLLRQLRIDARLSQEALAERARISLDTVGALERGRRQAPHRDTLALISEGLGLAPEDHARLEAAAAASRRVGQPRISASDLPTGAGHVATRVSGDDDSGGGDEEAESEPKHNLPYPLTSLFGRERELQELATSIRARRLITLHGPGGVGKTRLAIEAGRAQLAWKDLHDGVWFVDLGVVADPAAVTASIAHVLGIREVPGEPLLETVADALRQQHMLLVLDSCEHLLEPAALIAQRVAQTCPAVRVLMTSREALEIDGELVYHLDALALPPEGAARGETPRSLDELRQSPAVQMFLDRASDTDPQFFPTAAAQDPEAVAEICERLDGLPLTLELAAARVRDLTLREICAALDSRFSLLAHGKRTAQRRHRTLRALLEWSYALLSETEQRVFRRLGVFAGSWTVDAAVAVCDEPPETVRDAVATLVSKSLVTVVHDAANQRRYRLLESLRAFARTLAKEHGETETARLHAEYYRERAQAANAAWHAHPTSDPGAMFGALIADMADVRAALDWSIAERHDVVLGAELASVLADAWAECGLDAESLRILDAARTALDAQNDAPHLPSLRIRSASDEREAGGASAGAEPTLPGATPDWLASFGPERAYRPGDVVFRAGEEAGELFYMLSGIVALEEIGLELGPNELLGEIAFFTAKNRRTASAVCKTAVVVRSIERDALVDLYDSEPAFRLALTAVLTRRLLQDLESVRDRHDLPRE